MLGFGRIAYGMESNVEYMSVDLVASVKTGNSVDNRKTGLAEITHICVISHCCVH